MGQEWRVETNTRHTTHTAEQGRKETQTGGGTTWVHFNGGGVTTGKVQVCRHKRLARGKRAKAHGDSFLTGSARASGRCVC